MMKVITSAIVRVLTLSVVVSQFSIGFANADENIFCSDDAEALLGDICVDSQGQIPDNADIREAIVGRCDSASHSVNARGSVLGFYNAFYDEYGFCTKLIADDGSVIYYLKFGYDNSRLYRYSVS